MKANTSDVKPVRPVKSKIAVRELCERYGYLILNLFQDLCGSRANATDILS